VAFGFIATFNIAAVWRELASLAGGMPVLLWGLSSWDCCGPISVAGTTWWLGRFNKLLVIPPFLAHFRRSERSPEGSVSRRRPPVQFNSMAMSGWRCFRC
jgi:hypothetical protein